MKILFYTKAQYVKKLCSVAGLLLCLLVQGCLEVEQELIIQKDGSGTLKVQGVLGESFTQMVKMAESLKDPAEGGAIAAGMLSVSEADLAIRFKGEGISIAISQFETKENKLHLSYTVAFDTLQNLLNTRAFQERQISFYKDKNDNLAFQFVIDAVRKELFLEATAEEVKEELKIGIKVALPGAVLESNADSQEGSTLTWHYTKDKMKPEVMSALCEGTGLAFVAKLPTEPKKIATAAYVYDPTGKADPFRPFILEVKRPKETIAEPLQPLQRYEISQLQLVGIIWMPENPRAVLEDAAGKGFIVSKGALVGKNDGKVTEIFQDEVIVTEKSTDILGETKIKEIKIRLHEQEAKSK